MAYISKNLENDLLLAFSHKKSQKTSSFIQINPKIIILEKRHVAHEKNKNMTTCGNVLLKDNINKTFLKSILISFLKLSLLTFSN